MLSAAAVDGLTYGWSGLGLAFAAVQAPMLVGMIRARARIRQMLVSPLVAVPLTAAVGIGLSLFGPQSTAAALGIGGALSVVAGYAAGRLTAAPRVEVPLHQRGARVVDAGPPAVPTDQPTLAGLEIPAGDEAKHFKFIGTTGTGKSTAIGELIGPALRRGDRAVIADPDGGYLRRYYDPARGDVILNPFDLRSVKWDLFGEIRQPYDVEQLARSLIPDPESGDRTWHGYARTWLTAVTRQAHAAGVREVGELYRLLSIAPTSELRTLTAGTAAQPFLEQHNVKMFDSIRSVASSAVASLEHIAQQRGAPFSVREWIRRGSSDRGGVLFIPYRADQIAALRSSVSTWMRIAIFEAMAGPEQDQRLWFVIDELDAIGQIDGLKDALARLRKFGGRCILGFQSVAQVASTYGADAHTIVENCGNSLILRCSASEGGGTARFASTLIGQREVLRTTQSRSSRPDEILGSVTRSEHFSIEPAVLDSEIEQLPDLAGYLKFASHGHWLRVQLQPQSSAAARDGGAPAFVPVPPAEMPASSAVTAGTAPAASVVAIPAARRTRARAASARSGEAPEAAVRTKSEPTGLEL
jgi:Type IV secretion-system coupling protein DNA-binding domain